MTASRRLPHRTVVLINHSRSALDKLSLRCGYATLLQNRPQQKDGGAFDEETDVLIIGSGGAGLTAALRCHANSLKSIVVEKTDLIGGSTALSGGGIWIPNNLYLKAKGKQDTVEKALTYMNHAIGDVGPASSAERRMAFLHNGPRMIEFLRDSGFRGRASGEYPNYYPDLPGGEVPRSLESAVFDAAKLGSWYKHVRSPGRSGPPIHTDETSQLLQHRTSIANMLYAARTIGPRVMRRLIGQSPVTLGKALVSQLLYLNLQRNAVIWRNSPLTELVVENGKVEGAVINQDNKNTKRVRARRGVLLVAGGFAQNAKMREQYQEGPIGAAWTSTQPGDQGDAIRIGMGLGAQVALMDDAWWGPAAVDPSGDRHFLLFERAQPYSIIVDSSGSRFMNEAQSYTDAGHAIYIRNRDVPAIPAWLVLDSNHRRRYPLLTLNAGATPKPALESGFLCKGDTLEELANQTGVNASGLKRTVERLNGMAHRGHDEDFGRGGNAYDRFFGDRYVKPNGNLGPIEKPPFYALKVWPGDLGTKGGLLTDEMSRVLDQSGKPIEGLYAAGNTTASVMGRAYPGPGATLGPALTFAYIAVNHMAGKKF